MTEDVDTSLTAREPALVQGIVASLLATAGLFGVQETEGVGEIAFSTLVAALPLVGAMFVRGRVSPVAGAAGAGAAGTGVLPAGVATPGAGTSLPAREPAVVQGIVASLLAVAGLFGVQATEGPGEILISALVAGLPLIGAVMLRGRVTALPRPASRPAG